MRLFRVLLPALLATVVVAWAQELPCGAPASDAMRTLVLRELNTLRARPRACGARGAFTAATPLTWNTRLEAAAAQQALWLAPRNELTHAGPGGGRVGARVRAAGYEPGRVSENLALGQPDIDMLMQDWASSEDHCANLMDPGVHEVALACWHAAERQPLWVLVLARPR